MLYLFDLKCNSVKWCTLPNVICEFDAKKLCETFFPQELIRWKMLQKCIFPPNYLFFSRNGLDEPNEYKWMKNWKVNEKRERLSDNTNTNRCVVTFACVELHLHTTRTVIGHFYKSQNTIRIRRIVCKQFIIIVIEKIYLFFSLDIRNDWGIGKMARRGAPNEDLSNIEFETSEDVEVVPTFNSMVSETIQSASIRTNSQNFSF